MKPEFSRQIFGKKMLKFHENPTSWSGVHAGGRKGGHDEANSRIFRNFAHVPKNIHQGTVKVWGP